jgi:hypothetical protein
VSCFSPGLAGGGLGRPFFDESRDLLAVALEDDLVEGFFERDAGVCAPAGDTAAIASTIKTIHAGMFVGTLLETAREWEHAPSAAAVSALVAHNWRGIGIPAKRFGIAPGQDFNHPVIEIIHWMRLNGLKPSIVFFMSLFNVITQSYAQIFVLAPHPDIFRTQQLDILHRNLGDAIGAPMQFLLIRGQRSQIKNGVWFRQCDFSGRLYVQRRLWLGWRLVHNHWNRFAER